jgi:hypothetical protein
MFAKIKNSAETCKEYLLLAIGVVIGLFFGVIFTGHIAGIGVPFLALCAVGGALAGAGVQRPSFGWRGVLIIIALIAFAKVAALIAVRGYPAGLHAVDASLGMLLFIAAAAGFYWLGIRRR